MNIFNPLIEVFRVPSAQEMATRELEEAKRELLQAYTAQEYASAAVQYNSDRVARLERTVPLKG